MKHTCKEFWDMIDQAKAAGCKVLTKKSGAVTVIPSNKNLPIYTCHEGERGIHPLRRYLKNTCKLQVA
jgi:hypothetical protein